jgi:hypothetical protein
MANTFELIASTTVGAGGASAIDFTSIPSTFTDLCVKLSLRDTTGSYWNSTVVTFNGSSSGYSQTMVYQANGSASGASAAAISYLYSVGSLSTSNTFANADMYIPNYTSSNNKSVSIDSVTENNGSQVVLNLTAGLWSNTAAINRVTITKGTNDFAQYSTAYLYGIVKS